MLGTALQFGGVRGEDRFYIPVKARKNQNQRKQGQRAKNGELGNADLALKSKHDVSENSTSNSNSNLSQSLNPTLSPSVESVSNIDRFLDSTMPLVPAQYFSKVDLNFSIHFLICFFWPLFLPVRR